MGSIFSKDNDIQINKIIKDKKLVLSPGGKFDKTKVMSPDIIYLEDKQTYRLFYIGTSSLYGKREGYQILSAYSKDGLSFFKISNPIIPITKEHKKIYSPKVIRLNENLYRMFFSIYINNKYIIFSADSNNCLDFKINTKPIINTSLDYQASVHSPKLIYKDKNYFCYYTGSNDNQKIYSKKYPFHDFSNGFKIFLAKSKDAINFKFFGSIKLDKASFINMYGHNIIEYDNKFLLFFSGFDLETNKIYISFSYDGLNFQKPICLITPDESNQEIGCYSCSVIKLNEEFFRIYYGVRFVDNTWRIYSCLISSKELRNYL
jgi:predicted GH43/DUF377 family glycosyl hydrolase